MFHLQGGERRTRTSPPTRPTALPTVIMARSVTSHSGPVRVHRGSIVKINRADNGLSGRRPARPDGGGGKVNGPDCSRTLRTAGALGPKQAFTTGNRTKSPPPPAWMDSKSCVIKKRPQSISTRRWRGEGGGGTPAGPTAQGRICATKVLFV